MEGSCCAMVGGVLCSLAPWSRDCFCSPSVTRASELFLLQKVVLLFLLNDGDVPSELLTIFLCSVSFSKTVLCPFGPGLGKLPCSVPFVYMPNELFLRVQKLPLFLPLIPGRMLDAKLNPPAEEGRGLMGDDEESGDAVWARLKESKCRKLLGRFGDFELGGPGENGIGLDAYADAVYVALPNVCGVCG